MDDYIVFQGSELEDILKKAAADRVGIIDPSACDARVEHLLFGEPLPHAPHVRVVFERR